MAPLGPPKPGPGPALKRRSKPGPPGSRGPCLPDTVVVGDGVVVDEPPVWATATPMPPTRRTAARTAIAPSRRRLEVVLVLSIASIIGTEAWKRRRILWN